MGKTKSQKLKTNKRETDYVSLNDKYDNTHIRFEDEVSIDFGCFFFQNEKIEGKSKFFLFLGT